MFPGEGTVYALILFLPFPLAAEHGHIKKSATNKSRVWARGGREGGKRRFPLNKTSSRTSLSGSAPTLTAHAGGRGAVGRGVVDALKKRNSPRVVAPSTAPLPIQPRRRLQPNYPPRTPSPPEAEGRLVLLLRHRGGRRSRGHRETCEGQALQPKTKRSSFVVITLLT